MANLKNLIKWLNYNNTIKCTKKDCELKIVNPLNELMIWMKTIKQQAYQDPAAGELYDNIEDKIKSILNG